MLVRKMLEVETGSGGSHVKLRNWNAEVRSTDRNCKLSIAQQKLVRKKVRSGGRTLRL